MPEGVLKKIFLILQAATIAVFLGRAWQHLRWDAPYWALFWDENWMRPLVEELWGEPWAVYVSESGRTILSLIRTVGWFYLLCALAAAFIRRLKKIAVAILFAGGISLFFLALLYCKEKFFHLGQFLEYTLQWGSPFLLIWLFIKQNISLRFIFGIKIAIAFTFICHGLYAVGYYPRPGEFTEMTLILLQIGDQAAMRFLQTVGWLDFLASILIFLPFSQIRMLGLLYCMLWGFATTIARVWAHFQIDFWQNSLSQWLHESLYRFPHFLIPGALLLYYFYAASNRQNLR